MTHPPLTQEEWKLLRRRVLQRAYRLTRSVAHAKDLTHTAIQKTLEPVGGRPWNPERHPDFGAHLCDVVWSLYGNEISSYRVKHASYSLEEALERPDLWDPLHVLVSYGERARAERLYEALESRVAGDALIVLLLQPNPTEDEENAPSDEPGAEMSGDEPSEEERTKATERRARRAMASTQRAHAAGYTDKEIKNARERLKRHAEAVVKEDERHDR